MVSDKNELRVKQCIDESKFGSSSSINYMKLDKSSKLTSGRKQIEKEKSII